MKKNMIILVILMLWASPVSAQQATGDKPYVTPEPSESLESFDARVGLDYRNVGKSGNPRAGEYEYLKSSTGGALDLEWDPLPHRFVLESFVLNPKDYYGSVDYAYRDVVLFNMYTRELYHTLNHYSFGTDDPLTASPSSVDKNPGDDYFMENGMSRAFIRFKTQDFPFHLYADARTIDREGTIQQRYMRGFTGGLDRVSQSRHVDWDTKEVTVGANSHLGPLEADYSHTEKKFRMLENRVLVDTYTLPAMSVPHNLVPDLKSSSDTMKLHTSYSGRFVASATYSRGEKNNQDSGAKTDFRNMAGDMMYMPITCLTLFVKYRHYDLDANNPDTVTVSGLGPTYNVRDSLSSKRDLVTGIVRYRVTRSLTIKGEYTFDTVVRKPWQGDSLAPLQIAPTPSGTGPDYWPVANRTTKGTAKLGASYRLMNKLTLRADYSAMQVSDPAYPSDPDRATSAKASLTWTPIRRVTTLVSYGGVRESRDNLSAPLAGGSRKADRDQALGSLTVLVGKGSSVTASYMYLKNKAAQTFTFRDAAGLATLEGGVPYADTAQVASLSVTQTLGERVQLIAEASKCSSKGFFRTNGSVANTAGIDSLSDMRVDEDIYSAGLEMHYNKDVQGDLRYQQRLYNDKIDNTQDGRVNTILATVSVRW